MCTATVAAAAAAATPAADAPFAVFASDGACAAAPARTHGRLVGVIAPATAALKVGVAHALGKVGSAPFVALAAVAAALGSYVAADLA